MQFSFLLFISALILSSTSYAKDFSREHVKTPADWFNNGVQSVDVINHNEDDGEVRINGNKGLLLRLSTAGQIIPCKEASAVEICRRNLVSSAVVTFVKLTGDRTALLLFADDGRPNPGSFWIVMLGARNEPYISLHLPEFELSSIVADSRQNLIFGKDTLSQACCAEDAATYDPFKAFTLETRPGAKAKYSLSASEQYNRQHYVWAGPNSREDVLVQQHPGSRLRLIPNPDKPSR
jgi:hypothetical protein